MKEIIAECINEFIHSEFQLHPTDFYKEEEIRSVLYTNLKKSLSTYRRKFPTELSRLDPLNQFASDLVRCEYSYENSPGKSCNAFDIAILHESESVWVNKQSWENYTKKKRKAEMYWNQPVQYGIELKAVWHAWEINRGIHNAKKDRDKLKSYSNSHYFLEYFKNERLNFEGVSLLFSSYEPLANTTALVKVNAITITSECQMYCVTPNSIYSLISN